MDYLGILRAKRTAVADEIEQLRTEQKRLAQVIGTREGQLRNLDELLAIKESTGEQPEPRQVPSTRPRSPSQGFLDEALGLIRENGDPLHYQRNYLRDSAREVVTSPVGIPQRTCSPTLRATAASFALTVARTDSARSTSPHRRSSVGLFDPAVSERSRSSVTGRPVPVVANVDGSRNVAWLGASAVGVGVSPMKW